MSLTRGAPPRPTDRAQIIVIGNEKGGAGKSTLAIHIATALLHAGARVAVIDLDLRQQSLGHFFASRRTWSAANGVEVPMPWAMPLADDAAGLAKASAEDQIAAFDAAFAAVAAEAQFVLIDTPGSDTGLSRLAHGKADLIITPMNDSFVDFDMLGQVDPVTLELIRPSVYSEVVWEARKQKMLSERRSVDWVVLRNRLATSEARNRKRLEERIDVLAKRVGFRVGPGMRDRVIFRELFPFGLTVADLSASVRPVPVSLTHVAARQELRAVMQAAGLGDLIEPRVVGGGDLPRPTGIKASARVYRPVAASPQS
jgi:chromosome partitioning protein